MDAVLPTLVVHLKKDHTALTTINSINISINSATVLYNTVVKRVEQEDWTSVVCF